MKKFIVIICFILTIFMISGVEGIEAVDEGYQFLGEISENEEINSKVRFSLSGDNGDNIFEEIHLVGLSESKEVYSPVMVFRWKYEGRRGWLLQLAAKEGILPAEYVDGTCDDGFEYIDLKQRRPIPDHPYEASLSINPGTQEFSVSLNDLSEEISVYSVFLETDIPEKKSYIFNGGQLREGHEKQAKEAVVIDEHEKSLKYQRMGLPLAINREFEWYLTEGVTSADEIGLFHLRHIFESARNEDGIYEYKISEPKDEPGIYITWPERETTGKVELYVSQEEKKVSILSSEWNEDGELFLSDITLPRGYSEFNMVYRDGDYTESIDKKEVLLRDINYDSEFETLSDYKGVGKEEILIDNKNPERTSKKISVNPGSNMGLFFEYRANNLSFENKLVVILNWFDEEGNNLDEVRTKLDFLSVTQISNWSDEKGNNLDEVRALLDSPPLTKYWFFEQDTKSWVKVADNISVPDSAVKATITLQLESVTEKSNVEAWFRDIGLTKEEVNQEEENQVSQDLTENKLQVRKEILKLIKTTLRTNSSAVSTEVLQAVNNIILNEAESLEIRKKALEAMKWSGSNAQEFIEDLSELLFTSDTKLQKKLIEMLGKVDKQGQTANLLGQKILQTENEYLNRKAVDALANIGAPAIEPLLKLLTEADSQEQMVNIISTFERIVVDHPDIIKQIEGIILEGKKEYQKKAILVLDHLEPLFEYSDNQIRKVVEEIRGKRVEFFVSPEGNDSWSGRLKEADQQKEDGPFATIERAKEAIIDLKEEQNGLKQPVTVFLREGEYFIESPLIFRPEDSGELKSPITYAAYPDEEVIISGGKQITGWEQPEKLPEGLPKEAQGEIWMAEVDPDWKFRQLFVDGKRAHLPRLPEEGFYHIAGLTNPDNEEDRINRRSFRFKEGDIDPDWTNLNDVEVVKLFGWSENRTKIRNIDEEQNIVHFDVWRRGAHRHYLWWGSRYYVENVYEGLSGPGQWYLNRQTGKVIYWPREGEEINEARVIAPVTEQLIRFEGNMSPDNYVENINISGIKFNYTGASLPQDGYFMAQQNALLPGSVAIYGTGTQNIRFSRNEFAHIGNTYVIEFAEGNKNNVIIGNEFNDLAGGGIKIGDREEPNSEEERTHSNIISHNYIHDGNHIYLAAGGVLVQRSGNNVISYNKIHDNSGTGIVVGWKWEHELAEAYNNIIEYNHIFDIGGDLFGGNSGIYTLSRQPGTRINNNLVYDIRRPTDAVQPSHRLHSAYGIHLDNGSGDIVVENNVVYNTADASVTNKGIKNYYYNNIFGPNESLVFVIQHEEADYRYNLFYFKDDANREVFNFRYHTGWQQNKKISTNYNLFWNQGEKDIIFGGNRRPRAEITNKVFFDRWQQLGYDVNSIVKDPLFLNPENPEEEQFALADDSPAFDIGFRPIDLDVIGPHSYFLNGE